MRRLLALGAAFGVAACGSETATVSVDLRSDFVAGREFTAVSSVLTLDEGGMRRDSAPAVTSDDFGVGKRVAELRDVPVPSRARLVVELLAADGTTVVRRGVVVQVAGDVAVTILVTRDCGGVRCPGPGDAATRTECLGGRCVEPECTGLGSLGDPACAPPECRVPSDCPPLSACAVARCESGTCFYARGMCGPGLSCDIERGCVGAPMDAGALDAGARVDAGIDAGRGDSGPPPDGGFRCSPPLTDCDGDFSDGCENTMTDPTNCGICGASCGIGETCNGGRCACGSSVFSVPGRPYCQSGVMPRCCSGTCRDLASDHDRCGSCTSVCDPAETCYDGRCGCGATIRGGAGAGAACPGGCCIVPFMPAYCANIETDVMNCGACGTACSAGETCSSGRCRCGSIVGPLLYSACGPGSTCSAGTCSCGTTTSTTGPACASGRTCCDDSACYDLARDPRNCGACRRDCGGPAGCSGGMCVF